jgi:ribosomal protein L37AE/L43A
MTHQEFILKRAQESRLTKLRGALMGIFFLLLMLAVFPLSHYIEEQENWRAAGLSVLGACTALAIMIVATGGVLVRRQWQKMGFLCPNCRMAFVNSPLTVVTGNCAHCGTHLIDLSSSEPKNLPTKADFLLTWKKHVRKTNGSSIPVAFIMLCTLAGGLFYIHEAERRPELKSLDPFVLSVMLAGLFGSSAWVLLRSKRMEQKKGLRCPHCRRSFRERFSVLIASGRCGFCGGEVLQETYQHAGSVRKDEFLSRVRSFRREQRKMTFVITPLFLAWLFEGLRIETQAKHNTEVAPWENTLFFGIFPLASHKRMK